MSIAADAAVGILRSKSGNRIVGILARRTAAGVAACVVILSAGLLSAVWAFTVPIFQAPDEPAHFDYAISIYNAGHLVRASDGPSQWIVSPYTKYLMKAVDFDRIKGHSSMRVAAGYGSRAFFEHLDRRAPLLRSQQPSVGVSYIVSLYPFAFYAVEALIIKAAATTTGSLTAAFYAARLLCVALMMVGLTFGYLSMLNLRVRPWLAVGVLAAVGFFPLTSLVSSYVQPDNLAFAAVAATVFFGTRLRAGPLNLANVSGLGVALALLAVSKYQCFVSAAFPVLLLFGLAIWRDRRWAAAAAALALVAMPSLVLLAVQHWIAASPLPPNGSTLFSPVVTAFSAGASTGIRYVTSTSAKAFWDFFLTGPCAQSYWGVLGWVDTALVVGNVQIQDTARLVQAVLSALTFVMVFTFAARNLTRIGGVARSNRLHAALRLAASDPLFNSYALFVFVMTALYVTSDNAFGAEGRHWYPYIVASFLAFVCYAPRALRGSVGSIVAKALCIVFLSYSSAAAAFGMYGIVRRYYGPVEGGYSTTDPRRENTVRQRMLARVWRVGQRGYHVVGTPEPATYPTGTALHVSGVALVGGNSPHGVAVSSVLDEREVLPTISQQYDYRINAVTGSVSAAYAGFDSLIDSSCLSPGKHDVVAYARLPGDAVVRIAPERTFVLVGSSARRCGTRDAKGGTGAKDGVFGPSAHTVRR